MNKNDNNIIENILKAYSVWQKHRNRYRLKIGTGDTPNAFDQIIEECLRQMLETEI